MAILRPMITPTVGIPQNVVASRRPRNMTQREFYSQGSRLQSPQQEQQTYQPPQQQQNNQAEPQFEQPPITGDYLGEYIARINNRNAPPSLEPGARVKSAVSELVQPSSFQTYYEQLQSIQGIGQQATATETARAAYRRMQELQNSMITTVGGGLPVGYKNTGTTGGKKSLSKGGNKNKGSAIPANLSGDREVARRTMQNLAAQWGWSGAEWDALQRLIMKESGFNPRAANPTSSARGLFQKMTSIHGALEPTIEGQILWGFNYIKKRYGSPSRALSFHLGHNWY